MYQIDGDQFRRNLGKKIRQLRTTKDMTQIDLAKALGYTSTGTISQVESGIRGLRPESILRAAEILDVHPIVFLTSDDLSNSEIEVLSELFKLFEKRRTQPFQARAHLIRVNRLLDRMLRS